MKISYLIIILFFCVSIAESQNRKKYYELSFGLQRLENKQLVTVQPFFDCWNGGYSLSATKEKSLILANVSFLRYRRLMNKSFYFISGFAFNQKGYVESGVITLWENPSTPRKYSVKHLISYIGLQLGLKYKLLQHKNFKLSLSQILNPEMRINTKRYEDNFKWKKFVASTITSMRIEFQYNEKMGFVIKPFFQTAISNYNILATDFYSTPLKNNYRPFGYGLNVGILF